MWKNYSLPTIDLPYIQQGINSIEEIAKIHKKEIKIIGICKQCAILYKT